MIDFTLNIIYAMVSGLSPIITIAIVLAMRHHSMKNRLNEINEIEEVAFGVAPLSAKVEA